MSDLLIKNMMKTVNIINSMTVKD